MSNPFVWQLGKARAILLVDGDNADLFFEFVKDQITGNCYYSLIDVREQIKRNPDFGVLSFCLCVFWEDKVYALSGGMASLALVRGGQTHLIIPQGKALLISGISQPQDEFTLRAGQHSYLHSEMKAPLENTLGVSFRDRAAALIDKLLVRIPERRIIIHEPGGVARTPKKATIAGLVLLGVLGVSIYFGILRQRDNARRQEYEPKLIQAVHNYDEALEVAGLSKTRSRELILASRETARELSESGVEDERLTKLLSGISEHLGPIAGIYDTPAQLYLDLGIVASGFEGNDLAFSGGTIRVLDSKNRRLVGVEVSNKRTDLISGSDYLPNALATAAYADRSFILSSDGIREVTGDVELVIKSEWDPEAVFVTAFAGNIYVFDKQNNQIWRYQGVQGGFLEKQAWLGEGFTIDLSDAISWSIDGSIWTINSEGAFKVYSMGAPATFSVSGNTAPFKNIVNMFTTDESKFIYILDQGSGRISVIDKNGQYIGEYVTPELNSASDLAVDEDQGKIIFLANSKLYSLPANHLNDSANN